LRRLIVVALTALIATACSSRVQAPSQETVSKVDVDTATTSVNTTTSTATTFGERYDADAEEVIATDTLTAWRVAVKHAKQGSMPAAEWKSQRAADEKEAMRQLVDLQERYPKSSTVRFMMGQVEDHFGKHDEAVKHFRASTENNTHNSMYVFKLAEAETKSGQYDKAIEHYRMIQSESAEEWFVKLGLARALLKKDPKSVEAHQLLEQVAKAAPENEEAKALLAK
jgi:predicted Zn-dependent protease